MTIISDEQFCTAIRNAGLQPPEVIEADGRIHRFSTNGEPSDKAGWYVLYDGPILTGAFGCWRTGVNESWRADISRTLSLAEESELVKNIEAQKRERNAQEKRCRARVKNRASMIWDRSCPAPQDHPYLVRKRVQPNGCHIYKRALVVPLRDGTNELQSLQFISTEVSTKI